MPSRNLWADADRGPRGYQIAETRHCQATRSAVECAGRLVGMMDEIEQSRKLRNHEQAVGQGRVDHGRVVGIGYASALEFARRGCHVAGTARSARRSTGWWERSRPCREPHGELLALAADVREADALQAA